MPDTRRVLRGGSFYYDREDVRCAYRHYLVPNCRSDYFGIRVVVNGVGGDTRRVLRGGSFNSYRGYVRCACRSNTAPSLRDFGYGFRVVTDRVQKRIEENNNA